MIIYIQFQCNSYIFNYTAILTLMFYDVYVYTFLWGDLGTNRTNYCSDWVNFTPFVDFAMWMCPLGTVFESRWWSLEVWTFAFVLNAWPLLRYQRYVRIFMEKKVLDTQYGEEDWIIKGEVPTSCNLPLDCLMPCCAFLLCHLALLKSGSYS